MPKLKWIVCIYILASIITVIVLFPYKDLYIVSDYFRCEIGSEPPLFHFSESLVVDYMMYNFAPIIPFIKKIPLAKEYEQGNVDVTEKWNTVESPPYYSTTFPAILSSYVSDVGIEEFTAMVKSLAPIVDNGVPDNIVGGFVESNELLANYFGIDSTRWVRDYWITVVWLFIYLILSIVIRVCLVVHIVCLMHKRCITMDY